MMAKENAAAIEGAKQVVVSAELAQKLGEPMEAAQRSADEARDTFKRSFELEAELIRAHDALMVIAQSLQDFAHAHSGEDERRRGLTQEDVSLLFGAVALLEGVAAGCDRAVL